MIGDTLTMENLLAIFNAMAKIKPIDQSEYFRNYMEEVIERLQDKEREKEWIEAQLYKAMDHLKK